MYITKYGLSEQILLRVKNQVTPSEIDVSIQEVMLYITQSIGNVVKMWLQGQEDDLQEIDGTLIHKFSGINVEGGKLKYIKLPTAPVGLPMNRGIQSVYFEDEEMLEMIPLPNNYKTLYGNLASSSLQGQTGYWNEGDKIYFHNFPNLTTIPTMGIKMVTPLGGLDTDEQFFLLPEVMEMIIKDAVSFFSAPSDPEDKLNDKV